MLNLRPPRHTPTLREAVIHCALGDRNRRTVPRAAQTLTLSVALDLGMNLAPIRIEDTHRDGARRPINVGHKRDGARDASCVGAPFPKDVGRTVEELDSVLHDPSPRRSVATLEHSRPRVDADFLPVFFAIVSATRRFRIAGPKPFPDALKHVFRLSSALAVKHGVVGVPGEPDAGQMPRHPKVERVMQEQVGQDRRHDAALRRALVARLKLPIRALHRRFQPTLDVEQDPGFLTVLAQSRHQEAVIEIVEQPSDVELHHPVLVPATASGDGDRLQRRFPRPIAIGVRDGRSDQAVARATS